MKKNDDETTLEPFDIDRQVTRDDYLRLFRETLAPYEKEAPTSIIDYCVYGLTGALLKVINPCTLGRWAYFESSMYRFTGEKDYLQRARELLMVNFEAIEKTPKHLWDYPAHWRGSMQLTQKWETPEGQKRVAECYAQAEAKAWSPGTFSPPLSIGLPCSDIEEMDGWESTQQREYAKKMLAELVDYRIAPSNFYSFDNNGANNRALTSARGVLLASRAFPEHPNAEKWRQWSESVIKHSLDHTSDEDALGYQCDWFHSILILIELMDIGQQAYFEPYCRAYFEHCKEMMTPMGQGIGYGDGGDFHSSLLPVLEKGATVFGDGVYRYLASQHFNRHAPGLQRSYEESKHDLHAILWRWMDAYRWADDAIQARPPEVKSTITCEGKVVLRSGQSLLALTSDEGRGHGHMDANAIAKLVVGDSVLLTDGGYQWSEAVNHNRLLWREGKPEGSILNRFRPLKTRPYTLQDQMVFSQVGASEGVETKWRPTKEQSIKVRFLADFSEFTAVGTTLGPQERTIVLDADEHCLVFDHLMSDNITTVICLYYVSEVMANGDNWVSGRLSSNQSEDLLIVLLNPPDIHTALQVRDGKMQTAVYGACQGRFPEGTWLVSALLPQDRQASSTVLANRLRHQSKAAVEMVTIAGEGGVVVYGCQSGKQVVTLPGGVETDAELIRLKETKEGVHVSMVNGTMLECQGRSIFSLPIRSNVQITLDRCGSLLQHTPKSGR